MWNIMVLVYIDYNIQVSRKLRVRFSWILVFLVWKLIFVLICISEFNFSKNTKYTQFKFLRCLSFIKFSKFTQLKYMDPCKYISIWPIWKHTHTHTSVMQSQSSQETHFHKKSHFHKNHMCFLSLGFWSSEFSIIYQNFMTIFTAQTFLIPVLSNFFLDMG